VNFICGVISRFIKTRLFRSSFYKSGIKPKALPQSQQTAESYTKTSALGLRPNPKYRGTFYDLEQLSLIKNCISRLMGKTKPIFAV
jgi:hypothetical protein